MIRSFDTGQAPHFPPQTTVARVMLQVILALVPAIAAHVWYFGPGIIVQIIMAAGFALGFEAAMLAVRRKPVRLFLGDYSAILTAILFALCLPPLAPWWIALIGMFFAIVIAKHLFGGLGHNLFNPAMVGYVAVLISFPRAMTAWLEPAAIAAYTPGLADTLMAIATGAPPANLSWDAVTGATPLDAIRTSVATGQTIAEARQSPIFGDFGGLGWEWIANWYAIGGLWLLWRRIISWQVPVTMIGASIRLIGRYSSRSSCSARSLSTPSTTRSGRMKSSTAAPSPGRTSPRSGPSCSTRSGRSSSWPCPGRAGRRDEAGRPPRARR